MMKEPREDPSKVAMNSLICRIHDLHQGPVHHGWRSLSGTAYVVLPPLILVLRGIPFGRVDTSYSRQSYGLIEHEANALLPISSLCASFPFLVAQIPSGLSMKGVVMRMKWYLGWSRIMKVPASSTGIPFSGPYPCLERNPYNRHSRQPCCSSIDFVS